MSEPPLPPLLPEDRTPGGVPPGQWSRRKKMLVWGVFILLIGGAYFEVVFWGRDEAPSSAYSPVGYETTLSIQVPSTDPQCQRYGRMFNREQDFETSMQIIERMDELDCWRR